MAALSSAGLMTAVPKVAEFCALLAVGHQLRASGVLRWTDGQTAARLATYITLPAVIVRALCMHGPLTAAAGTSAALSVIFFATITAANWLYCLPRSKKERAVLTGCGAGLSLPLLAYPLVEAAYGSAALQPLILVDLLNTAVVCVGSYLLFATAGPAFPESFKHEDGGTYRGQWRGLQKEGLGVYSYASGARYEGEWRENVKDGRGVYYYPKGGMYEGEWSGGTMNGIGVRTFSTGQVKSGRWCNGQLESPLDLWQCANAAEGAAEAAMAAKRTDVGGGKLQDGLQQLLHQPTVWATALGIGMNLLHIPLPPAADAVTATLALVNGPLLLLAAGITISFGKPQVREMADVVRLLSTRLLVPLFITANLLLLMGPSLPSTVLPLAVTLLAFLAPVPPQAEQFARRFRLNEALATSITGSSNLVCIPLMAAVTLAAAAAGILPSPSPFLPLCTLAGGALESAATSASAAVQMTARSVAVGGVATAAAAGSSMAAAMLAAFCLITAAAVAGTAAYVTRPASEVHQVASSIDKRIRMVYQGPPGSSPATAGGSGPLGATASAAHAPGASSGGDSASDTGRSSNGISVAGSISSSESKGASGVGGSGSEGQNGRPSPGSYGGSDGAGRQPPGPPPPSSTSTAAQAHGRCSSWWGHGQHQHLRRLLAVSDTETGGAFCRGGSGTQSSSRCPVATGSSSGCILTGRRAGLSRAVQLACANAGRGPSYALCALTGPAQHRGAGKVSLQRCLSLGRAKPRTISMTAKL